MCGIIGYSGNKKALPILINGLKALEYRGYDSAGIAYIVNKKINIIKRSGRIASLEKEVDLNSISNVGIGHTRWATHGIPNEVNSHPHKVGSITLVHNGIIENYAKIKSDLLSKGYSFKTETDTEVACALIDYLYKRNNNIIEAINQSKDIFKGSYAFGILVDGDENIYCTRQGSPLVIGLGENENFIASDIAAFLSSTKKYILLEDNDIGIVNKDSITIYNHNLEVIKRNILTCTYSIDQASKNGYNHFMLKEIHDEPEVIKHTLNVDLESCLSRIPDLSKYKSIDIVACGSAYHTGLVGKSLIEEYAEIPVNVEIASEYRYKKVLNKENKLVILVSQSGETADTLACLRLAKENNIDTMAIVNVVNSSIAREANSVLYINAGPEIAVATTKAYSAQVAMMSLITLSLLNKMNLCDKKELLKDIKNLPNLMKELISRDYVSLAKEIYKSSDIFFIGRGIDYALAMEGSLKIKEISYIHSEAYAAGELKHGTISLIEENTPVLGILTDEKTIDKTISNLKEVEARGAKIITVGTDELKLFDYHIVIPKINKLLQPLLTIIPLQMLAYEVAKVRECDIDKPKNLAKSVTVE